MRPDCGPDACCMTAGDFGRAGGPCGRVNLGRAGGWALIGDGAVKAVGLVYKGL